MKTRLTALAIAGIALFGLTACTGGSPENGSDGGSGSDAGASASSEQTVDEACSIVNDTIEGAVAEFEGISMEDPAAAVEAFQAAGDALGEEASRIGNPEVAAVLPDLETAFATVAEAMDALAAGDSTKLTELESVGSEMQASFTEFQRLCLE